MSDNNLTEIVSMAVHYVQKFYEKFISLREIDENSQIRTPLA